MSRKGKFGWFEAKKRPENPRVSGRLKTYHLQATSVNFSASTEKCVFLNWTILRKSNRFCVTCHAELRRLADIESESIATESGNLAVPR